MKKKVPHRRDSSKIELKNHKHSSQIDTLNTHKHDHSFFKLGTGISIKSGGVKLVLWIQPSL